MTKRRKNEIERIMATWSSQYKKLANEIIEEIQERILDGEPINLVVKEATQRLPAHMKQSLTTALLEGASAGYGAGIVVGSQISDKLFNMVWSPDGFSLSDRLHNVNGEIRNIIASTISDSIKRGSTVNMLARKLYDGYGNGKDWTGKAELPEYLQRLIGATRKMSAYASPADVRAYLKEIRNTQRMIASLRSDNALKSAYERLLKGAEDLNEKSIKNAIKLAVAEKSRYYAERIARTETAKAWSDGFYTRYLHDDDVIAFKWDLSSSHEIADICDFYASADLFGLGSGIYPKWAMPPHPAHPHCTCHISPVFKGEVTIVNYGDDGIQRRGDEYFKTKSVKQKEEMLGRAGFEAWKKGADWREVLKGWSGLEEPATRLNKTDFK